eukprot:6174677-Pleurochrysis_carterae.AAC.4
MTISKLAVRAVRYLDELEEWLNDAVVDALFATPTVLSLGRVAPPATRTMAVFRPRAQPKCMSASFSTHAHALIA